MEQKKTHERDIDWAYINAMHAKWKEEHEGEQQIVWWSI